MQAASKDKPSDDTNNKKSTHKDASVPDADFGDGDDSSIEDTYSVVSNSSCTSASTSAQKDPKHCDCCYCEVFGHGVVSRFCLPTKLDKNSIFQTVAPVSRNYQEMRERLRLRLNMKKKNKSAQPQLQQPAASSLPAKSPINRVPVPPARNVVSNPPPMWGKTTKEEDLDTLLQFIEGNSKGEIVDEKKLAKRARQKQKKQEEREEKERQEREAERLRLEALKKSTKKSRKYGNNIYR